MEAFFKQLRVGQFASVIGRYYAMDRDNRWSRTQAAYDLISQGNAAYTATSAHQALENAYTRGETDEFVLATSIHAANASPVQIQDNDVVIFMNFRADRARALTRAFTEGDFKAFPRTYHPHFASFVTLTEYAKDLPVQVAYPPLSTKNGLGEYLASLHKRQLRIAETEKYAHVTFFFNGGRESPFPGEDRELIPSPKVATYDLQPEMSALTLTESLVTAIKNGQYDVIICNYANPDMVATQEILQQP
jgi:2,3-bisphosphoglycerate-independent phosphoglycerate mutase